MNPANYLKEISEALKTYNWKTVTGLCNQLISELYISDESFNIGDAEKIMQQLRSKRMFTLMQKVGDALIQTGRHNYKIRRQYAQALIDQNMLTAAIGILKALEYDTANAADAKNENTEARGLLGRSYKQLYVNAGYPKALHSIDFLKNAIKRYLDVYTIEPRLRTWHGINAVALLKRAITDDIELLGFPQPDELAQSILATITDLYDKQEAEYWDFATAAEACVALNNPAEALQWMSGYVRMPYCDAFEVASTLRQLEEVWQLDMSSPCGMLLLPLLRSELLNKQGEDLTLNTQELKIQKATENNVIMQYNSLVKKPASTGGNIVLEKVFGEDSFKTYKWYMKGADRCLAVARIGRDSTQGFGTGFLLKGSSLHELLGDELLLITNAHVVSDVQFEGLSPNEAVIIFEALNRDEEFKVSEIIWSSPSGALDTSVIRFGKEDQEKLKELTAGVKPYPLSKYLPVAGGNPAQKIYAIGHPFGGTLQVSFQDNVILDHQDPKIHYRTPTAGGSSGSPIFNQEWDLIGLHHAGANELKRLNGKSGNYQANEGIWIESIRKAFAESMNY